MNMRDITLLKVHPEQTLVIACDSCGGVGDKPGDIVTVPPEIVGYYTCRVAAMEVMAVGAEIKLVIDTLSVEWDPTGKRILDGIQQFLSEAGVSLSAVNGSTEENFTMSQTAMGITVIGSVHPDNLQSGISRPGDVLITAGLPKVGSELKHPFDPDVISTGAFNVLLSHEGVHDIVPVGSKGIRHEAEMLASINQLAVHFEEAPAVDLDKSGGPATCVVAAVSASTVETLKKRVQIPVTVIGTLGKAVHENDRI